MLNSPIRKAVDSASLNPIRIRTPEMQCSTELDFSY